MLIVVLNDLFLILQTIEYLVNWTPSIPIFFFKGKKYLSLYYSFIRTLEQLNIIVFFFSFSFFEDLNIIVYCKRKLTQINILRTEESLLTRRKKLK